jgi:hypothetical protein
LPANLRGAVCCRELAATPDTPPWGFLGIAAVTGIEMLVVAVRVLHLRVVEDEARDVGIDAQLSQLRAHDVAAAMPEEVLHNVIPM